MLANRRPTVVSFVLATLLLCVGALAHAAKPAKSGMPRTGIREFTTKAGVSHRFAPYEWETKGPAVNGVRQVKGKIWGSHYSGTEALNPAPSIKLLRSITLDNGQINTITEYKNGWVKKVFAYTNGVKKQTTTRGSQTFVKWLDKDDKPIAPPIATP